MIWHSGWQTSCGYFNVTGNEEQLAPDWTVFSAKCPSRKSLARIADKWTAMIVISLHAEPLRFTDLHARVEGITKKVLTDTLRALERDGMIKHVRDAIPHPHYRLTTLGHTLHEPLRALQVWAEAHVEDILAAQATYDEIRDSSLIGKDDLA